MMTSASRSHMNRENSGSLRHIWHSGLVTQFPRSSTSSFRNSVQRKHVRIKATDDGERARASLESLWDREIIEPTTISSNQGRETKWPTVDWSRYNLQLLFVDRTGTVRSRLAASLFERIAEWNGFSRALMPWASGLHKMKPGEDEASLSKMAAIFSTGSSLGLWTRGLAQPVDAFDIDDLDVYDLILALDRGLYDEIIAQVPPEYREHYSNKVLLLTKFSEYESESVMLRSGGFALLPLKLSWLLRQGFRASAQCIDVPSPDFTDPELSAVKCREMVQALILCCGGLAKYLMDSHPDDLPSAH